MKYFTKTVLPLGFKASAVASGIKKSGKLDLCLFYSEVSAKAACVFTTNTVPAAPVLLNKAMLKKSRVFRAVIVNSGNANCFTGGVGIKDANATAQALASSLGVDRENILVHSTGIIGRRLPVRKIKSALPQLVSGLSRNGIRFAKKAILTTDTFSKESCVKLSIGGKQITVCGVAKGAGMIAPDMATLLGFIFTDACISQPALDRALRSAVARSFNCITVDGCMSTNDTICLLANGKAANSIINKGKNFSLFSKALEKVCLELAKMVIKDGEGASKFIEINVDRAKDFKEAKTVALAIANSNLFKTAIYGENPNFGRIFAAVGASGVRVKEKDLKIKVSPLNKKNIEVHVSLGRGSSEATVFTSDLTPEYIKINAEYN